MSNNKKLLVEVVVVINECRFRSKKKIEAECSLEEGGGMEKKQTTTIVTHNSHCTREEKNVGKTRKHTVP